jgi:hypothetical protein
MNTQNTLNFTVEITRSENDQIDYLVQTRQINRATLFRKMLDTELKATANDKLDEYDL